jgi:hypothetical protein
MKRQTPEDGEPQSQTGSKFEVAAERPAATKPVDGATLHERGCPRRGDCPDDPDLGVHDRCSHVCTCGATKPVEHRLLDVAGRTTERKSTMNEVKPATRYTAGGTADESVALYHPDTGARYLDTDEEIVIAAEHDRELDEVHNVAIRSAMERIDNPADLIDLLRTACPACGSEEIRGDPGQTSTCLDCGYEVVRDPVSPEDSDS